MECLLSPCLLFDVASLGVQELGHFWINMVIDTPQPLLQFPHLPSEYQQTDRDCQTG